MLRLGALARWPAPLGGLLLVLLFTVASTIWGPFVWFAAAAWGLWAAAAVFDAGLRGRYGLVTGLFAVALGPLGASLIALLRRRSIRKVPREGPSWLTAISLMALLAGTLIGGQVIGAGLRVGPHGVDVPQAAMGDDIMSGDRVLVVPIRFSAVGRGDVVAVARFKGVDAALGTTGTIAGVGRIVGTPGEVIGAIDGKLYICEQLPDAAVGLRPEDGCTNPAEMIYLKSPTPDFGPIQIPAETLWVMSDDRGGALIDSRVYGPVPLKAMIGRVVAVLTPLPRIAIL